MTPSQFLSNIPQYLAEGTAVAAALGTLGAALSGINTPATKAIGKVLTTVYLDVTKILGFFGKSSAQEKKS